MAKITPRIADTTEKWLSENFSSKHAGAELVLDAFPVLYRRGLADLKGQFSGPELSLLLDAFNGLLLAPNLLGQHLVASATDGIRLEGLAEKWGVEPESFLARLDSLSFFERACLEIWLRAYWESGAEEDPKAWVGKLT
jgi:hypothetical protein